MEQKTYMWCQSQTQVTCMQVKYTTGCITTLAPQIIFFHNLIKYSHLMNNVLVSLQKYVFILIMLRLVAKFVNCIIGNFPPQPYMGRYWAHLHKGFSSGHVYLCHGLESVSARRFPISISYWDG